MMCGQAVSQRGFVVVSVKTTRSNAKCTLYLSFLLDARPMWIFGVQIQ